MGRKVKDKAFDDGKIGHNQDTVDKKLIEVASEVSVLMDKQVKLSAQIKDKLNDAKDNYGILKGGVRKAVKLLRMTEDARQAQNEVEAEAERIFELCSDLPLFAGRQEEEEAA